MADTRAVMLVCRRHALSRPALTFIQAVCGAREDVVHLVGHATGLGHEAHRAGPVQLAGGNVVQGACSVSDAEGARLRMTARSMSPLPSAARHSMRDRRRQITVMFLLIMLLNMASCTSAWEASGMQAVPSCPYDRVIVRGLHAPSLLYGRICMRSTWTPPTVAGPRRILLCLRAYAMSFLVSASGTPSAMTATTRMVGCFIASMLDSYALHQQSQPLQPCAGNMLPLLCLSGLQMTEEMGCFTAFMLCTYDTAPQGRSIITICEVSATQNVCACCRSHAEEGTRSFPQGGYDEYHCVISPMHQPCPAKAAA